VLAGITIDSFASGNATEAQDMYVYGLPERLGGLFYSYLQPRAQHQESLGDAWQLVTAIHDEGDDLIPCE
jgi:hypothetical protein